MSGKQDGSDSKRLFKKWSREATIVSILIHLLFIGTAVYIVAMRVQNKPEAVFRGDPPPRPRLKPRELEMKVRVQDLQKQSARPRLQPRMVSMSPSEVALPEIKKNPDADKKKVQRQITNLGMSGLGSGIGGGLGTGLGGGGGAVNFFGLQSTGNRIAYLVDFSCSMNGKRARVMRKELIDSINALPNGSNVSLIFFAGDAWEPGQGPGRSTSNFKGGGKGSELKYTGMRRRPMWKQLAPHTKRLLEQQVNNTKLYWGTDWKKPFQLAYKLNPKPDVIYFMTDGSVKNTKYVLKSVKNWNGRVGYRIPINAVAIGDPKARGAMKQLANQSRGGKYRYVNVNKYKR